jgi:hypothetical protein
VEVRRCLICSADHLDLAELCSADHLDLAELVHLDLDLAELVSIRQILILILMLVLSTLQCSTCRAYGMMHHGAVLTCLAADWCCCKLDAPCRLMPCTSVL